MTVCLYLNGGVPIIITDALQSRPGTVVYSPENCNFIGQRGRLKALRSNGAGDSTVTIARYPLTKKWKLFNDNVVIAFSGARTEVDRFIKEYGEYITNSDGSGAVVDKLNELQFTQGAPRVGFTVVAPTSSKFVGLVYEEQRKFWPFDEAMAVGTGAEYIHFMYARWLHTQIGAPVNLGDRLNYIMMADDFLTWLNGVHVTSSAPYALRRYRQKSGRTFGGFFQGIYFSPEDGRWLDLRSRGLVSYARIVKGNKTKSWTCTKHVREICRDFDREVHVMFRDSKGEVSKRVFPIHDPFGDFTGFHELELPPVWDASAISVNDLNTMHVSRGSVQISDDLTATISESRIIKIEEKLAKQRNAKVGR